VYLFTKILFVVGGRMNFEVEGEIIIKCLLSLIISSNMESNANWNLTSMLTFLCRRSKTSVDTERYIINNLFGGGGG
jgi:hypothetical protein